MTLSSYLAVFSLGGCVYSRVVFLPLISTGKGESRKEILRLEYTEDFSAKAENGDT